MSLVLTPISLRQSLNIPIQSLNVPIFATFPGIMPLLSLNQADAGTSTNAGPASALFGFEYRGTFFHVRGQAFFCVFTLKENLLILALHGQRGLHGNFPTSLHGAFDSSHSLSSLVWRTKLPGVFDHVLNKAIAFLNIVDDAELLRLFERECIAGNHQFDRFAFTHQS